jgi:hypothetical protein
MVEPVVAFTLFDKVLTAIGLLREGKRQRSEKTDQALLALYAALNETKAYTQQRKGGAPRETQREFALANLWHRASIPLRELDPELAEKCFIKGGYWMEPDAWTDEKVKQSGIAIDQVFEQTRSFLCSG